MWQAGVYSTVMHYLKAIEAAGTNEPLKVAAKMRDMPVDDFFAHNGRLREDGLMVHELMLVQVKKAGGFEVPLGLLSDPHSHPRRTGVWSAQSGLSAGQRMSAPYAVA